MNAPPFPPNPQQGQRSGGWTWSEGRWVCTASAGTQVLTTVFTASAPYTPSPGLISVEVECGGGGGGGGSAGPVPNVAWMLSGGGGGSGGYSKKTLAAALVLGGVNVVIGAGGTPGGQGAGAGQIINGTGGAGGATSFGALCVANGGAGGEGNNANTSPVPQNGTGGNGAQPGIGDIASYGQAGGSGFLQVAPATKGSGQAIFPGAGGASRWAGTGYVGQPYWAAQFTNGASAPPNSGGGGQGSVISETGGGPLEGGAGGSGICIVTEYIWSDTGDDGGCGCEPTSGAARVAIGGWQGGFDD